MPSWQVAPPRQGCGEHSLTLIRQSGPENPRSHKHLNHPCPDSQVPPLWQGCPWHWSIGSEQNAPPQPEAHKHCNEPPNIDDGIHEPPFKHWPGKHCVARSVQILPDQPGGHSQLKSPSPSTQIPPFLHGFGEHSFKSDGEKKLLLISINNYI